MDKNFALVPEEIIHSLVFEYDRIGKVAAQMRKRKSTSVEEIVAPTKLENFAQGVLWSAKLLKRYNEEMEKANNQSTN